MNKTNVFPIPDGDTGSNLVSTMNAIVEDTKVHKSIKNTINSMADAALVGARGNSGIIFAQFLNGIDEEISYTEVLTTVTIAQALKKAVPYAYKAILNPVEGTMITVIREWVDAVYKLKDVTESFEVIIIKTLEDAKISLANTPNILKILKKSSVVDSGASGFVSFLQGVVYFLEDKNIINSSANEEKIVFEEEILNCTPNITYRYCTEALISNENVNTNEIKNALKHLGDSLIVAGNKSKVRIHIHTNKPDELFYILRGKGEIVQQKVDDMKKQYEVVHNRINKTAILTDSIADLPQELIEKYQIHVLPLNLIIEGSTYLDKLTIKPDKFYSMIDNLKEYPTSSQPTIKNVQNVFSFLTSHYESVITIIVSKEMSGTFNIVKKASEKFIEEGRKITIINSKLNSGAQGLIVLEAAKELEIGKNYEEVVKIIENKIKQARIYVSVNTFKYMVRGGRVSPMKGVIGKLLNLKPIISINVDGKGIVVGKTFSAKSSIKKIIAIVNKANENNKVVSYNIVHANAFIKANELSLKLTTVLRKSPEYITEISPIVGLSAGIGSVAVSFISS
ncbi:DAK2 domain-containing protein [Clostridium psychrophilum]|uniref:DAK2 domain-containing protein n=1 Tax=Clostridium psychrophilum TaxID=132926 RepID=UPI001C0B832B|nr:DegV family protein [Clostridium psychrophilum]MBU3182610.1 DegV family EDD domain-containing protein [Clostridium psychrophilum]